MPLNIKKKRVSKNTGLKVYFDETEQAFLKLKAAHKKQSVNSLVRHYTQLGLFTESLEEIEERLTVLANRFSAENQKSAIPSEVLNSVFFVEAMFREAWKMQDVQVIYRAQDEANRKVAMMKEQS